MDLCAISANLIYILDCFWGNWSLGPNSIAMWSFFCQTRKFKHTKSVRGGGGFVLEKQIQVYGKLYLGLGIRNFYSRYVAEIDRGELPPIKIKNFMTLLQDF